MFVVVLDGGSNKNTAIAKTMVIAATAIDSVARVLKHMLVLHE